LDGSSGSPVTRRSLQEGQVLGASGLASDVIVIEPFVKFDLVDLQPGLNPPLTMNPNLNSAKTNLKPGV
jgi:hypothetical protein